MFKQDNVAEHFQTAVEDVLQRISLDVGYRPQVYEQSIREYGALSGVNSFLRDLYRMILCNPGRGADEI